MKGKRIYIITLSIFFFLATCASISIMVLYESYKAHNYTILQNKDNQTADFLTHFFSFVTNTSPIKTEPQKNTLYIPRLKLKEHIIEGKTDNTLEKGLWRRPLSSIPSDGGNTVLVGHRHNKGPNSVFFNLDKVKKGDEFYLSWEGEEYRYRVNSIRVVEPEEISIENNTKESIVTLYTCTPVYTEDKRLVIRGVRVENT